ncbi:glycosyltransferase family 9 protein [Mucilaginibacter sp. HD30]
MMKLSPRIKKIGIFRALQLGDMLCIIPAIRALRAAYPQAEIVLLGLPWAQGFTERFNEYFDRLIHFPGYPGLPEQPFNATLFAEFLPRIHEEQFDLILQMQGNGSVVNSMVQLLGAKQTAGFKVAGHYAPDNDLFLPYPDSLHEIERHVLLMEYLGIPAQGSDLEFPLTDDDYNELRAVYPDLQPQQYVCVHPGSRGAWRQWPIENFAALADYFAEQGFTVILTGTKDELPIVDAVSSKMKNEPGNAAGKTSLGAIGVLIKNAAMLISNCTSVSHIAAAFKTPSIVISMDGEPERWGPMNKRLHRTINWLKLPDFHAVFRETVDLVALLEDQTAKG